MAKAIDLTGKKFGRLTVIKRTGSTRAGKATWLCSCLCGAEMEAISGNLVSGATSSCGCLKREVVTESNLKNWQSEHPLYGVWCGIKKRCHQETANNYKFYGGKGVRVCERWLESFWNFANDMGERPVDDSGRPYEIDRVDSDGHYTPDNCRWISREENSRRAMEKRWASNSRNKNCGAQQVGGAA